MPHFADKIFMKKQLHILLLTSLLIAAGCSEMPVNTTAERVPASGAVNIISTPKTIGFIFLGKTKSLREDISSAEYVLNEDIERERILNKEYTPIGDFLVKPGTVLKLTKNATMYTKAANIIRGLDKNSAVFLKEGTTIRVLQYNQSSLTQTIAIIEVVD